MSSGEPMFDDDADITLQNCWLIPQHLGHNQVPFVYASPCGPSPATRTPFIDRWVILYRARIKLIVVVGPFFPTSFYTHTYKHPRAHTHWDLIRSRNESGNKSRCISIQWRFLRLQLHLFLFYGMEFLKKKNTKVRRNYSRNRYGSPIAARESRSCMRRV